MELKKGRPENDQGRVPKEIRVYELLDSLEIEYERIDHEAAMTMEACVEIDKAMGTEMCKNLFLCNRQETDFYLLMMPAEKPFKTKDISAQIGSARLSFGKGEYMEQFLDITPGSLSVIGLMNDADHRVQLLIDEDVLKNEYVGIHPCVNTSSIKISVDDLVKKILPYLGFVPTMVKL